MCPTAKENIFLLSKYCIYAMNWKYNKNSLFKFCLYCHAGANHGSRNGLYGQSCSEGIVEGIAGLRFCSTFNPSTY